MDVQRVYQTVISTINGDVQAQGFKVNFPAWMVLGSLEWAKTPDRIKAYAYQAAKSCGWSDDSLIQAVVAVHQHIDRTVAELTLSELKELERQYPLKETHERHN